MNKDRYIPLGFNKIKKSKPVYIKEPILSPDDILRLNMKLRDYKENDVISLKYYKKGSIRHITGVIKRIDIIYKLIIIEKEKINLNNLIEIY